MYTPPVILDTPVASRNFLDLVVQSMPTMEAQQPESILNSITASAKIELNKILEELEPKADLPARRSVTFAPETQNKRKTNTTASPSPKRYRTRAVIREELEPSVTAAIGTSNAKQRTKSPLKTMSPTRVMSRATPSRLSVVRNASDVGETPKQGMESQEPTTAVSAAKILSCTVPSSAAHDPMNRRLNFDSTESERKRELLRSVPDAPSFDLDTPPDENEMDDCKSTLAEGHAEQPQAGTEQIVDPASTSITPVPHGYQKRIIKPSFLQQPPFVVRKDFTISKAVNDLYTKVCKYGRKIESDNNKETIIDFGIFFVSLEDLADSIAPRKKLVNSVCEIGIHVICAENKNTNKYIMPLRIAVSSSPLPHKMNLKNKQFIMCNLHECVLHAVISDRLPIRLERCKEVLCLSWV